METESLVRYSIVVPFFNEQENIPALYMKLTEVMDAIGEPYELVFIDDGSKDNSFKVLSDIYEHDRRVNLIRLRRNFGQTPALKAGFDFARGDVIISMDGDLQHDPVSGVDLHDFGTTFKAYRREIIQEIQLYGELHRFIPALASTTGARIVEVPIENLERKAGRSNYGISRTIRVFLDLLIVKFLLDYSTRPLQFFGLLGMAGAGSGVLIGVYVLFEKFYYHMAVMQQHGPLMLLSIALLVSGIQFISMGLLGEIMARTYYESQNKPIYALREVKSHRKEMGDPAEPARPSGNTER